MELLLLDASQPRSRVVRRAQRRPPPVHERPQAPTRRGQEHPGRHRQAEERQSTFAHSPEPVSTLPQDFVQRQHVQHVVEAGAALRDRARRLRDDPDVTRSDGRCRRAAQSPINSAVDAGPAPPAGDAAPRPRNSETRGQHRDALQDAERARLQVQARIGRRARSRAAPRRRAKPSRLPAARREHLARDAGRQPRIQRWRSALARAACSCFSTSSIDRWRMSLPSTM